MNRANQYSLILLIPGIVSGIMSCNNKTQTEPEHIMQEQKPAIQLTGREEMLAGITLDTVQVRSISFEKTLTGKIYPDEKTITLQPCYSKGRIEKLHIRTTGIFVKKGEPLYDLYSEELLALLSDYRFSLRESLSENKRTGVILELASATKKKLLLKTISEEQIATLVAQEEIPLNITFCSPVDGYILNVHVREGEYKDEGAILFTISSIEQLRVEALIYTDDFNQYKKAEAYVEFLSKPGVAIGAKYLYENPVINNGKKFSMISFVIDNKNRVLKPGTMVYLTVYGESKNVLTVPAVSLITDGQITHVWVSTGGGRYEPRKVETGRRNKNFVEVVSGIREGEIVVSGGAYLLQSAYVLRTGTKATHTHQ